MEAATGFEPVNNGFADQEQRNWQDGRITHNSLIYQGIRSGLDSTFYYLYIPRNTPVLP